jgi:hypothetical protein
MRLNGWQRLWILAVILWGVVVAGVSTLLWPTNADSVPTTGEDITSLVNSTMAQRPEVVIVGVDGKEHIFPPGFDPKRAAEIVRRGGEKTSEASPTIGVPVRELEPVRKDAPLLLSIDPNAAKPLTIVESKPLSSEPLRVVASKPLSSPGNPRNAFLLVAFAVWAIPSSCVYALGFGVAWVRRGFKAQSA